MVGTSGPNRPQLLGPEDLMETGYGERVLTTFPNKITTKLSQKVPKNSLVEREHSFDKETVLGHISLCSWMYTLQD